MERGELRPDGSLKIATVEGNDELSMATSRSDDSRPHLHQLKLTVPVAAFDEAPDTRRGNAGIGIVSGPGLQVWDISLRRRFSFTENMNLQFQADLFNAFNRANFLNLSLNTSNADFGSITSSAPGRNVQFGLKLTF